MPTSKTSIEMQRKDAAIRMLIFTLCRSISCGACRMSAHCKMRSHNGDFRAAHRYECYRMWAEEVKDFMCRVNLAAQPDCAELAFIQDVLEIGVEENAVR